MCNEEIFRAPASKDRGEMMHVGVQHREEERAERKGSANGSRDDGGVWTW